MSSAMCLRIKEIKFFYKINWLFERSLYLDRSCAQKILCLIWSIPLCCINILLYNSVNKHNNILK